MIKRIIVEPTGSDYLPPEVYWFILNELDNARLATSVYTEETLDQRQVDDADHYWVD